MKRRALILGALLLIPSSLAAQTESRPLKELSFAEGGELHFDPPPSRARLEGRFSRDGVALRFISRFEGDTYSFDLLDDRKQSILRVDVRPEFYDVVLFREYKVHRTRIEGKDESEYLKIEGDEEIPQTLLRQLIGRPEYQILPNLAIELAHLGIGGADAPVASFIHGLGVASATVQNLEMPPLFEQLRPEIELVQRGASFCKDLLGDPCRNECYGMCGNGRTCWYLICGNCCGYEGCYTHDWVCRCKGTLRFGCVTFTAFFKAKHPCQAVRDCRQLQCE